MLDKLDWVHPRLQELGALLTMMEMDGHVESRPGLRYALAAQGE